MFFKQSDEIVAVFEEAKQTVNDYIFSSMICMLALSTAIQCTIQSPMVLQQKKIGIPWLKCLIVQCNVHFFHCAAMPKRYLVDRKIRSIILNYIFQPDYYLLASSL